MSRRADLASKDSRVSINPSQVSGANIGVLGQRQETLSLPENSGMPRRSPRSRCPSPTPGEAGMETRDTKTVTDQVGAAAGQSSTDDQAYIPSKIKLEILAVVVSALAMVATVGFGIAPFTAIIAAVIFAASVSLLIRHVRESFAETRKALGKVKELRDGVNSLSEQVKEHRKLLGDAGELIKDQQTTLQRAGNEAKSAREQASALNEQLQAQRDALTGAEAQAVNIVERLRTYAEAAEISAQTALVQVNANMGQALELLGNAESKIGAQIEEMRERVNVIFTEINSLVEQQKRILSVGLAEYKRNKEGNPKAVTQLLEVVKQALDINSKINEKLRGLQTTVNEGLNEVQRVVNVHIGQLRDKVQEAQRQVQESSSKVENLRAQKQQIETQLAELKQNNKKALGQNNVVTEKIATLEYTLRILTKNLTASEDDCERAAETLGEMLNDSDKLIGNIEKVNRINGEIEEIVGNVAGERGWARELANMAGAAIGGATGGILVPVAGVAGGAAAGALLGDRIYSFFRRWL